MLVMGTLSLIYSTFEHGSAIGFLEAKLIDSM